MPLDARSRADVLSDSALGEPVYRCRACGRLIARKADLLPMSGDFEHVVFNPAGMIFRIWCFAHAEGLICLGDRSAQFSWFKGYDWRIAVCGECRTHLGWVYDGAGVPPRFYGLIRACLAEGPAD